jgi:hypothetical protein
MGVPQEKRFYIPILDRQRQSLEPTDCHMRFGNDVMDQQSCLGSVHHRIIATRHSILKEIARMQNLRGS